MTKPQSSPVELWELRHQRYKEVVHIGAGVHGRRQQAIGEV